MSKMIKLKSSDGKEFEVSETLLVEHSKTICHFIETASTENSIPPGDVTAPIIEKVLEYCRKHFEAGDASETETTVKGCIKDDDFAAEEEECVSIISGLKISSEEKGDASKTEMTVKGCIKDDDFASEKEECASIISGLSSEEKGDASKTETTVKGCIKDDDLAAEKEECASIISGLASEEKGDASQTETTVKGCIKDDDFAAEKEECASIISGLLSEEKGDASKTETTVKGCIKDDDLAAEKEECASIISGLASEEKGDASQTETTVKGCIKDDDFAAEKEECASIISGLLSEEKDNTMSKKIKLKSSDGKEFEVSETLLVEQSKTICHFIETASTENSIPPGDVTAPIIEKVLEYCRKHFEAGDASETETTVKGCIKDDDFAAEEEECVSIISGLKLSSEEKGDASKTETTVKGCIKDDDFAAEEEERVSIISGLSSEEKDSTTSKMIKLKSSDGKEFEVSKTVAQQSQTICHLIEGASTENSIQLVNVTVTSPILEKVFEYCKKHVEAADATKTETTDERCIISDEELKKWDQQFVDDIDKAAMLLDLIMAANYLYIEGLLDVTCRKMADNVMGKSTEEIRQAFNIEDDDQEECDSIISGLTGSDEKKRKKRKNKQKKKK